MDTHSNSNKENRTRQDLLRALARHLGARSNGAEMAQDLFVTRYHYQRVFRRAVGEPPGSLRRRLALERAAYDLRTTETAVTVIALEAGYLSSEGFSRAFRSAYGICPREYRRAARQIRLLPGSSGVHYTPPNRGATFTLHGGKPYMNLMDRLIESDYESKRRILECARLLSDRQLDAPLAFRHNLMPFVEPARTLRESLGYIVWSGWIDVMFDRTGFQPEDDSYRQVGGTTTPEMIRKFEGYFPAYHAFVEKVRRENLWDREWVDDTCDQPETFSIGQVLEAQLTWDIAYRSMLERQMEQMGFQLHEAPTACAAADDREAAIPVLGSVSKG